LKGKGNIQDVALVGIVGEGLLRRKGIAGRCFTAVAKRSVNIEMISFGPSDLYYVFHQEYRQLELSR
jgi:aspartokinase